MVKLQHELRQTHSIGQQQIQSLHILSMSAEELFSFARDIAESNCVIDIDSLYNNRKSGSGADAPYSGKRRNTVPEDEDTPVLERVGAYSISLRSFLRQQISERLYTREQLRILYTLISRVGDDGLLASEDPVIHGLYEKAPEQTESMLACLQAMEPAGVGARSVGERIRLQLVRCVPRDMLAEMIAEKHLELAAERRFSEIARLTGKSRREVEKACSRISDADPFPTRDFCTESSPVLYPDVIVSRGENGFEIELTRQGLPYIKIDSAYDSASGAYDESTREYLAMQYSQARLLQKSIEQRNKTLADVADCIFRRQYPFFLYGERCLSAMRQKEVADELNIHESTVSRAVNGKYLQCQWGTFPLKYFFSARCQSESGIVNPLCIIQELIAGEDRLSPVSDDDIAHRLTAMGMKISRRTVSKYRAELGIAPAKQRKMQNRG